MKVTRFDAYTTMKDGVVEDIPARIVVALSTPEARTIANGGTIEPMDLYDQQGKGLSNVHRVGIIEVKRAAEDSP